MEINSNAPIRSCHEITINAPLETVWRVHTQINGWPGWNPDIAKANLTGPIAVGTVFRWGNRPIGAVVPLRKLAWSGETGGILAVHVWNFSATPGGTHVHTEESWEGGSLPAQTKGLQDALDASLVRWLSFLKTRAEAPEAHLR
jgi:hypothetical protein